MDLANRLGHMLPFSPQALHLSAQGVQRAILPLALSHVIQYLLRRRVKTFMISTAAIAQAQSIILMITPQIRQGTLAVPGAGQGPPRTAA